MSIINAKWVRAAKVYVCEQCDKTIKQNEVHARLYGYAEVGDRPYVIREHDECLSIEAREAVGIKPSRKG